MQSRKYIRDMIPTYTNTVHCRNVIDVNNLRPADISRFRPVLVRVSTSLHVIQDAQPITGCCIVLCCSSSDYAASKFELWLHGAINSGWLILPRATSCTCFIPNVLIYSLWTNLFCRGACGIRCASWNTNNAVFKSSSIRELLLDRCE